MLDIAVSRTYFRVFKKPHVVGRKMHCFNYFSLLTIIFKHIYRRLGLELLGEAHLADTAAVKSVDSGVFIIDGVSGQNHDVRC